MTGDRSGILSGTSSKEAIEEVQERLKKELPQAEKDFAKAVNNSNLTTDEKAELDMALAEDNQELVKQKKLPCFLLTKKCIVSCDSKINWTLKSLMYMIQNIRCELERTLTKKSRVTPQGILSRTLKKSIGTALTH